MGLFGNKEKRAERKQVKEVEKQADKDTAKYFTNNYDLNIDNLFFNDKDKKLFIKKNIIRKQKQQVYDYSEIISYTPIFQGGKIKKHHGITRAITGGLIAGPIGALIGAGTGGKEFESIKQLGFMVHLSENRTVKQMFIESETKIDSLVGKTFIDFYNQLLAKFDQIIASNQQLNFNSPTDKTDDIRYYKQLLDDGIITQTEFEMKKKELLNL